MIELNYQSVPKPKPLRPWKTEELRFALLGWFCPLMASGALFGTIKFFAVGSPVSVLVPAGFIFLFGLICGVAGLSNVVEFLRSNWATAERRGRDVLLPAALAAGLLFSNGIVGLMFLGL